MNSYVEHANLSVRDTDEMIEFLRTALPDFRIRKRWEAGGYEWTHIGTDHSYIALMRPLNKTSGQMKGYIHNPSETGFNHICVVVDSVESVQRRLVESGYRRGFNNGEIIDTPVRRSIYFHDCDGREFEFMQYLTSDVAARNSYEV